MTVTVDNGPLWLQYLVAFGTAGAAIFAGWAALTARQAAAATRDLVAVEILRDGRSTEEARWRQARRITVDLVNQAQLDPSGDRIGFDQHMVLTNSSPDPIFKTRLKMVVGDAVWGPQLVGTLAPWQRVVVTARLSTLEDDANTDAFARFVDVEGQSWVASARSALRPDEEGVERWIEEGRVFATSNLTAAGRGTIDGVSAPADLNAWRTQVVGDEGWLGPPTLDV